MVRRLLRPVPMFLRSLPCLALSILFFGCSSGEGGDGATAQQHFEALAACSEVRLCEERPFAQRIEDGDGFSMARMECALAALRDRTAGVLEVELWLGHGSGEERWLHRFSVSASGEVETAVRDSYFADEGTDTVDYSPSRRCLLKPASFFEDCLAQVELGEPEGNGVSEAAWDCVFPEIGEDPPWVEDCVEQAPLCE